MADTATNTQNSAAQAPATSFQPTDAQLVLIGRMVWGKARMLQHVEGDVKFHIYRTNTEDNKNIVVGLNSNNVVSKYGTTEIWLHLAAKTYSVTYEYLGKDYQVLPDHIAALLKDYKQVEAKPKASKATVATQAATIKKQESEIEQLKKAVAELEAKATKAAPKGK